jgi:small-conductance mechanosensitive channel
MATKNKQQKIYVPDYGAAVLDTVLFIFLASIYNSLLLTESLFFLYAIFFAPLIIFIWFFSYRMGKNVAIYNKCKKKIIGKNYKWVLITWLIIVVLTIIFRIMMSGYPIKEGFSYLGKVPLYKVVFSAMILAAIATIPAWRSASKDYNVKVYKRTTKKTAKKKKEDFEEL